jgi:cytochrome c-type biogenesis protein CcmH/NrfG
MRLNTSRLAWPIGVILIVACTLAAYSPAFRYGFIWDDDVHITKNPVLSQPDGLTRIWLDTKATCQYYPLTFSLFYLEHRLWGLNPLGYHVVNVLLHAGNALLLWSVLRRLGVPGGWVAAMLFALHPVEVESVAWVTEQKNTLSGLLALAALWSYLRFQPMNAGTRTEPPTRRRWDWYVLSLLLFALACLAKSAVAPMSGVMLLLTWWKRRSLSFRDLALLAPFLLVGALLALNTARLEFQDVGARGLDFARTPVERLLIAARAFWFYPCKLTWPVDLAFIYPRWQISSQQPSQWFYVGGVAFLLAVLLLSRRRLGMGPLIAVLCYGALIFPALGFANIYFTRFSFVADHFQYHAGTCLLALAGALASRIFTTADGRLRLVAAACLPACFLLGYLTWGRCHAYRDSMTLWTDTLAKNPAAWIAHTNLANQLEARGRPLDALGHYIKTTELKPDDVQGYLNLGCAYFRRGDMEQAIAAFERGLRCPDGRTFDRSKLENNLGSARVVLGDLPAAIAHFRRAIQDDPSYADAHSNLGLSLASRGQGEEAVAELRTALRLNPGDVETRAILNRLIQNLGSAPSRSNDRQGYRLGAGGPNGRDLGRPAE